MKRFIVTLIAALYAVGSAAHATTIGFSPSPLIVTSGSPLQLDLTISGVNLHADGTIPVGIPPLGAWDVNVTFDPAILGFTSATFGTNLDVLGLGSIQSASLVSSGTINLFEISLDTPEDLENFQASNFTLTTLAFNAIGSGTSVLGIDINALATADGGTVLRRRCPPGMSLSARSHPCRYRARFGCSASA